MNLLVLDGNSLVNRAFYGIKPLSTKDGMFTNAIYGFLNILEKLKDESNPDAVAIAFDLKAPTFRHKSFDGYKAKRKGMPEDLAMQIPVLKELLTYLGYKIVSCEGYEADDILGTLSKSAEDSGHNCMLATGDRDSFQLISDKTFVRYASTRFGQSTVVIYDEEKIMETYGVSPRQLIDIKAIQGDASDNIPGVAGIGEKGAGELIKKYGSLEYIYENIDTLDIRETMKKKLIASKDNAILSYMLGTIVRDVPIDTVVENYKIGEIDMPKTYELMSKLELFKLIDKFGITKDYVNHDEENETEIKEEKPLVSYKKLDSCMTLIPMLEDEGSAYFSFALDIPSEEKTEEKPKRAKKKVIKLNTAKDYKKQEIAMFFAVNNEIIMVKPTDIFLKCFAVNSKIEKYTTDLKSIAKFVKARTGEDIVSVKMDTQIGAYVLNPSSNDYGMERLCAEYGAEILEVDGENLEEKFKIDAKNCTAIKELSEILLKKLAENEQTELFYDIEIPLAGVLADMELAGFKVNKNGLETFGEKLKVQISELENSIKESVGYDFNINSPKQLGEALFVKLGLPHGKKTKTGYSTNADVLESLRYQHEVVEDILTYRTLAKLNSTYCDGMVKLIDEDGRIHSSFKQTETRTGRISSTEPNLQNIPVRTPLGAELRKFFVSDENQVLVDADYSQIELRVLAHVSNDEVMIDSFNSGKDIHKQAAAKVFGVPEELVSPHMRSSAKAVNFGIVYGIGEFSLSKDIGVTRKEAENYIDEYLRNFHGVKEYMEKVIEEARENGYAKDIFGRRRYLPELASGNFNTRSFGERVARNMPIQGAAADIIKIAMIRVYNRLKIEKLSSKLILQVHDELIVECPIDEAEKVKIIVSEEMENSAKMVVPLTADAEIGENWYDSKG